MLAHFAFKNLVAAGTRTWLNTITLAIVIFIILFLQGIYDGFQRQLETTRINQETGLTQLWYQDYDPLDPLTINENHGIIPNYLDSYRPNTPILIHTATAYPNRRMQPVLLKGIPPQQNVLDFPTNELSTSAVEFPALIGERMAERWKIKEGDSVAIRVRTEAGLIDARDVTIVHIFKSEVPAIDLGLIWLPLKTLQNFTNLKGKASIVVFKDDLDLVTSENWHPNNADSLLKDTKQMIASKKGGASFLYIILMFLAGISIFDTQILSIFKRKKEIGLLLALGLTQTQIMVLFTLEGFFQGIFACLLTLLFGGPVLYYTSHVGLDFFDYEQFGMASLGPLKPYFGPELIFSTLVFVMISTTFINFIPARKIGKLSPGQAMRGNWS